MSTKTTFKRIALVAVAALGLSVVAVVPSNSAPGQADSLTAASATSTATVGTAVTNIVTSSYVAAASGDTSTVTVSLVSSPATSGVLPTVTAAGGTLVGTSASSGVSGLTVTVTAGAGGRTTGFATVSLIPDVAGTYVVRIAPHTGANAAALTWTVTASALDNVANAGKTTSFLNAGETSTATADATVSAAMTLGTDAVATIAVTPKNAADVALSALTTPATVALTATISGPGSLRVSDTVANATASPAGRAVTGTTGHYFIGVFSDGTPGVSTITISVGTTVLATETVTFYGDVASYSATVKKNVIPMGATTTGVIAVVAKDKDGNVVPSQTVHVKASDATVVANYTGTSASASEAAAGTATIQVIGIASKFGKLTLTIGNADVATITTTAVVTLSSTTAKTVTLAFDKAEYTAGEKMTLKATAVDANGLPVAPMDPITNALTSNTSLFGFPSTWDTTTTDGSVEYTFFAPLVPGPITVTGTDSNAAAITTAAVVVSDGVAQAAADAAAEAKDAADAATDAANEAAAAADAATAAAQDAADAVNDLAASVSAMITALRKQITALTNLVIKIQKKVRA